jgi:chemotaxis protein MotB
MEPMDKTTKDTSYAPLEESRRWRVGAISGWITAGVLALALIPATCTRDRVGDESAAVTGTTSVIAPVESMANRDIDFFRERAKGFIDQGNVEVVGSEGRTSIRFRSVSFFEPGQAVLTSAGASALTNLMSSLGDLGGRVVYFEGHADDSSSSGTSYASNWELAAARAASVAKLAIEAGLQPKQAVVVSYGDTRPAVSSSDASAEALAQNRRVSLSIMPLSGAQADRFSQR